VTATGSGDTNAAASLAPSPRTGQRRRDFVLRRLLALLDAAAVLAALLLVARVSADEPEATVVWGFVVIPVWTLLFKVYGLYERDQKRISHTTIDDLPWLFHAVLVGSLILWVWFRILPGLDMSFEEMLVFGLLVLTFVLVVRLVLREGSQLVLPRDRVIFIGASPMSDVLVRKILGHPEYGLDPVGYLSAGDDAPGGVGDLRRIGSMDELEMAVEANRIDRAIVATDAIEPMQLVALARVAQQIELKLSVLPDMHDVLGPSVEIDSVEGVTVLGLNPPVLSRSSRMLKRGIDIVGAGAGLLLAAPVMVAVAIAIKLDSRGPVFFRQRRIGLGGEEFQIYKFRTMVPDAEARRAELLADSKDEGWLHVEDDPRVTRTGRFLRHYSLDELPQLITVLGGHMSLVGPRPLIEAEDRNIEGWGRRRLDLTPGLTGLWQVLGRTNIPFEEMVKLDYLYVTNWSLWGDIRIIAQTLPVVIRQAGSN
jgi:exopolysaccharide biosynthesis polyprenyl glycosylphosphotransferase